MTPDTPRGAPIAVTGLTHRFGAATILDDINLNLAPGHVLALLGPSGCGKSTLLKLLAGLLEPTAGNISLGGQTVAAKGVFVPPERRGLGMVFQDYALWPHMSVGQNVAFPLAMRGVAASDRKRRVLRALDRVGLAAFADRSPGDLSGGQQQRVALARAIVAEPGILLFDEPMSNLDRELRETLCTEISELLRAMGSTAVYVTHDHEEALTIADTVAVMGQGRIRQHDEPDVLIADPRSVYVAEFLRLGALVPGHYADGVWSLPGGTQLLHPAPVASERAGTGRLFVPHNALRPVAPELAPLVGHVHAQRYQGGVYATTVRLGDGIEGFDLGWSADRRLPLGERVGLVPDWHRLRWLDASAVHA
ncbi:ABC transporter ATP-binding protein [Pigmentiphaga aceris]|uniref:ABC transporter ATP-binding protein n=1 Tax=Pigmentiphaga aceris TaxID=1940612 RepID=UPI001FE9ED6F|nr:ABC transporter ATP-binding protein [Pigmentiphaga aceris]